MICQPALDAESHFYAQTKGVDGHRGLGKYALKGRELTALAIQRLANFFGVRPEEIIFTSGATAGLNLFAQTWGRANLRPNDQIILSLLNHHSNICPWHALAEELSLQLNFLPIHQSSGELDLSSLESLLLQPSTRLLSLTHMSNVTGTFIPLDKVVAILKKVNKIRVAREQQPVRFLVDGAQGAPWRPQDFASHHLDFYILTGHKMFAATGIGAILARREHLISKELPPFFVGGGMVEEVTLSHTTLTSSLAQKYSAGTPHSAGIISLAAAADHLSTLNLPEAHTQTSHLATLLREQLQAKKIDYLTPLFPNQPPTPILALTSAKYDVRDIANFLDSRNIAVRVGHHCTQPLHQSLSIKDSLRFSFSLHNTQEEIAQIVVALQDLTKRLAL